MMMNQQDLYWESFLSRFSSVHVLQTKSWGDLKSKFGWEVTRLISGDAGVQILFRKIALGFCWAYIPKGPVGTRWEQIWPLVDQECRHRKAVFLKVEPDLWEENQDIMELNEAGFGNSPHQIQPARTLVVNLDSPEEEILAGMKQKTRYNIRLAGRKGVAVHYSNDVQRFFDLIQRTGERNEFGVHSRSYYQVAYDLFSPSGLCALIFAEYENELLAAIMVFRSGERAWYFYGASSDQHRNLMAPYAVQWEAIRWARNNGCREYDLWGVPDEDLDVLEATFLNREEGLWGVYRFKRGFGGELKRSAGAWDRVYNPLLYEIYRIWMKKIQS